MKISICLRARSNSDCSSLFIYFYFLWFVLFRFYPSVRVIGETQCCADYQIIVYLFSFVVGIVSSSDSFSLYVRTFGFVLYESTANYYLL